MTIQINNTTELLEFIKREDITVRQATEIVCKALRVVCFFEMTKDKLIKDTEYHINKYCINNSGERPIFLGQLDLEISIKDIYKN
jgi:hypothetical protein